LSEIHLAAQAHATRNNVDVLPVVVVVHHIRARVIDCKAHARHVIVCNLAPALCIDALAGGQAQAVMPDGALNVRS